jgi:hypothetical protein
MRGSPVTGILRVRHRVLQTPVIIYEHRRTGRTVTLVATSHIGQAAYYDQLRAMLTDEEAGALIYYEMINPAAGSSWAAASGDERAARDALNHEVRETFQAACRYLGWVTQAALAYSPSWRNADMTDLELIRRAGPRNILTSGTASGIDHLDVLMGAGVAVLFRLFPFDRFGLLSRFSVWGDVDWHIRHVVTDESNSRVLASLSPDVDIVLLWGAGHLPGLTAGLKTAGYRRRRTMWMNVGELPAIQDNGWDHALTVTADGNGLVGHAGGILLRKLAAQCGLTAEPDAALTQKARSRGSAGHGTHVHCDRDQRRASRRPLPCPHHGNWRTASKLLELCG